ncbi:transcription-repair coupling factor [Clostridium sp. AM25-23AC]|uniref:transcription-repair coupling factor n=1 Tax=Clostridium sp. AM25-23AC TaxID=2305240 RepID=UPI000E407F3E|nr:transcription-repair coupling factor [Clostridium sp. AM25-23AC]RGD95538.1 transcription-repair coupling factor [Clostridium sp. AM25-23AC]
MAEVFANPLVDLAEYTDMKQDLDQGKGPVQISGVTDSQKVHVMHELSKDNPWRLVVTYDDTRAKEIFDDFSYFEPNTWLYPARDLLFYSSDIHGNLLTRQRMQVFKHLLEDEGGVVVTTVDGLMDHLLPLSMIKESCLNIMVGQTLDMEEIKHLLTGMGYERMGQVDGMGQFSVRGGILDVFPLTEEVPVRIELWGDEVDSIRSFDAESQRSIQQMDEVTIYPAAELILTKEHIEEGILCLEADEKKQEKAFRDQKKPEEAQRIRRAVGELVESLKEGFDVQTLDAYIRYFCKDTVSFLDYMKEVGAKVTLVSSATETGKQAAGLALILDEPQRMKEKAETVETEFRESMSHRLEQGYILPGQADLLFASKTVLAECHTPHSIFMTGLDQRLPGMTVKAKYSLTGKNLNSYQNSFEILIKDLTKWKKDGYRVVLLSASRTRASRLAGDLREYDLRAFCPEDAGRPVAPGEILVTYGKLHKGFEYPLIKFVVITEGDMFGVEKRKKKRKKYNYEGKKISSFSELSVGDYVVHESHGLGIYKGIEKIEQDHVIKDYIKVEYGDGGNLYLPATRLEGIQKYAGADAKVPKLNKLGGTEWTKTKTKVRTAVREIAKELVELYAARQDAEGFQYGPDTVWQKEFEEMFPYDETDDQLTAIDDTKRDMESKKIMDRLICGDVGYGKTEIALRAAFKAVQEEKQVVYLVPTTILAQQIYNTFVQRMKDFPVRVDMMSRFRTPGEMKKTVEGLKKGYVDIIIGTHRVLSKDVQFKNLGLLIVDEEQRFGVTHKEKIKQMKQNVDVLTLTATPIPRTLHMSLIGIRDMSVLEEPPVDRVPIQTYVMEYNDEMIREAIHRELGRGGQVYYVYNRVNNIDEVANHVASLVPDANVAFAHGQMNEHQLEKIMLDFINGDIDVLVSTTIIETGLDIPNANTMIIQDADRLGLSQLYQIRGRIGRSNRTSYAFLMYKRDKMLKEDAEKRLQAIREFTELGSGIKIAMRDLEIRGAGNILGAEQHGHMEAVGYDLYCKMLNEAVIALKGGQEEEETFETVVDCDIDAFIPDGYIKNEYLKLDVYKRISAIETDDEYMDMQDELIDRFGDIPKSVDNLLRVAELKAMAHRAYVTEVDINTQEIRIELYPKAKLDVTGIPALIAEYKTALRFAQGEKPVLFYQDKGKKHKDCEPMMEKAKELLGKLGELAESKK